MDDELLHIQSHFIAVHRGGDGQEMMISQTDPEIRWIFTGNNLYWRNALLSSPLWLLLYTVSCGEDDDWLTGEQDSATATKRVVGLQQGDLQEQRDQLITVDTGYCVPTCQGISFSWTTWPLTTLSGAVRLEESRPRTPQFIWSFSLLLLKTCSRLLVICAEHGGFLKTNTK